MHNPSVSKLTVQYCNIKISKFDSTERKFDTKKTRSSVSGCLVHIPVDSSLFLSQNAHRLFRIYFKHNRELMNIQTKDNSVLNEAEHDK